MKRIGILITAIIISQSIVHVMAQNQKDPDEQIIVNKEFDENGNLIQYDSTYVHKWSSDSTFEFSFPGNDYFAGNGIPDLEKFFGKFFNDSVLNHPGFSHRFLFPPNFDHEDYFGHFHPFSHDSLFSKYFNLNDQFSDNFPHDSLRYFPHGFGNIDPDQWRKQFEDQLNRWHSHNFKFHEFDHPQQLDEWDKLMEKHLKEIEEFRKKWNDAKRNQ